MRDGAIIVILVMAVFLSPIVYFVYLIVNAILSIL